MRGFLCAGIAVFLLSTPIAAQQNWCWNADTIFAVVQPDGSIQVHHDAALYNCCPDPIEYDLSLQGDTAVLTETSVAETPCDCNCCFNLQVVLTGLGPEIQILRFRWFDLETGAWATRDISLGIPARDHQDAPAIGDQHRSPCLPQGTGVNDPPPLSWSVIKGLYR